jgi:hypothetical protein
MGLPSRKFITLQKAAELLNCSAEDIVHWAANGETKVGIPYVCDGFDPPYILFNPNGPFELNDRLEDGSWFAFIDRGYLEDVELTGKCTFSSLNLEDGRVVTFRPMCADWQKFSTNGLELPRLFIRSQEFNELMQRGRKAEESPGNRKARLIERRNQLKATGIKAFNQQTAQEEGISVQRLKQIISG